MNNSKMFTDEEKIACRRFDGIAIEQVIVAEILKGDGSEQDPSRISKVFYDFEGNQIFELDPICQMNF